ncbi:MaoC family dehydratase N-terminal domain-containing protein [Streptomyces sp. TBY4]|uniref:FAS1-like dehydratase domain-containing protein n=1 Tax=Streptomyces sp. TBY4 TaxID=2962030 RepID=UPI0020B899C6|nr:MaoC family dehydratase N-terminal domain-containing protein [Streptomyces sp. TBY4]MCP3755086.1 MaoC family dehydratase N-terminal domain-containing protein [Streptomyces sp. TBY4]
MPTAFDTSFAGRAYPPSEPYEVGRETIREFSRAVGAEAGDGRTAPPTFPIVLSMHAERQVIDDPGLGFDFSRVLHRDQKFEAVRPIRSGDRLVVVIEVLAAAVVDGNDVLTLRGLVREADGDALVCTTTSTLISRHAPAAEEDGR